MFKTLSFSAGALVLLSACTSSDPVYTQFHREAGSTLDSGNFGNSIMNNTMLMTGERQATSQLSTRFSSEVNPTVNFPFNSARLGANERSTLRQQAHWIKQFPEIRFRVYGHTDLVGSDGFNHRLGLRRANAVVNYLVSQGISRSRLEALVSFGETQPVISTQQPEIRNRRTVTEVSGLVGRYRSELDGKYAALVYREYVASSTIGTTLSDAPSVSGSN